MKSLAGGTEGLKYSFSFKCLRTENMLSTLYDGQMYIEPH